jgi:acyl-coenzyme A thioesterase PaaI-like protein
MYTIPEIRDIEIEGSSQCFACGKDNPAGLNLEIEWNGEETRAVFEAREMFQGGHGWLHGGITTCAMDEAMTWTAYRAGAQNVTARINVRFRKMVPLGKKYIITCRVTRKTSRIIETKAEFTGEDGTIYAEGTSTQFLVKKAEIKL